MQIEETGLKNLKLIKPKVYGDKRGEFFEAYRQEVFHKHGIGLEFVQDNVSTSQKNTVRGLHYQLQPASQAKLVMVMHGEILDVAVDLRENSPTFGQSYSAVLSSENHHMLLVPVGFAHGFSVLSDKAVMYYKCNDYYNKELERGVRWDDPALGIDWKVSDPILSEKDQNLPLLSELTDKDLF